MKTKTFDCVKMMHQGAAVVRRELAGKTLEERLDYWRRGTATLKQRQRSLRAKARKTR